MRIRFLGWKVPLEKWQPTPVFLPGKSHGQRSLLAIVHRVVKGGIEVTEAT